ncbi:hypothetical protein ABBQ32_000107 [Trebouxia sp. C0010 RCD-2024]
MLLHVQVTVAVTPNGRADAVCNIEAGQKPDKQKPYFVLPLERQMHMSDFLKLLVHQQPSCQQQLPSSKEAGGNSNAQAEPEIMYLQQQNGNFTSHFPELLDDVDAELLWASQAFGANPDAVNLWIGNDHSMTSFHKDHYENIYAVVTGEKTFTLLPPCDAYRMHLAQYPIAMCCDTPQGLQVVPSSDSEQLLWSPIEDLASHDCSEEYKQQYSAYFDPLLPKPFRVTVRAGEVLYLPSLWWHQVEQTAGIGNMVIAVNYWYDMQFDCKYAYFQLVESLARSIPLEHGHSVNAANSVHHAAEHKLLT